MGTLTTGGTFKRNEMELVGASTLRTNFLEIELYEKTQKITASDEQMQP